MEKGLVLLLLLFLPCSPRAGVRPVQGDRHRQALALVTTHSLCSALQHLHNLHLMAIGHSPRLTRCLLVNHTCVRETFSQLQTLCFTTTPPPRLKPPLTPPSQGSREQHSVSTQFLLNNVIISTTHENVLPKFNVDRAKQECSIWLQQELKEC